MYNSNYFSYTNKIHATNVDVLQKFYVDDKVIIRPFIKSCHHNNLKVEYALQTKLSLMMLLTG